MLTKIQTADQNLQLIQDNMQKALQAVNSSTSLTQTQDAQGNPSLSRTANANPFNGGNLLSATLTSGQDNIIPHGLNRKLQVWVIARQNADSVVWETPSTKLPDPQGNSQSSTNSFINLKCTATCTVTLWFN